MINNNKAKTWYYLDKATGIIAAAMDLNRKHSGKLAEANEILLEIMYKLYPNVSPTAKENTPKSWLE